MNARDYELKILERLLSRAKDRRVLWQLLLTKELSRLLRFAARLPPDVMSKVIAKELSSCANVTFEQVTRLVDNAVGIDAKSMVDFRLTQIRAEVVLPSITNELECNAVVRSMKTEPQRQQVASDTSSLAISLSSVVISIHPDDFAQKKDELKRFFQRMWREADQQYLRFDILEARELGRCYEYLWASPEGTFCETVATILTEKNVPLEHVKSFLDDTSKKSFAQHRYEHFARFGTILQDCESDIDGTRFKSRFVTKLEALEQVGLHVNFATLRSPELHRSETKRTRATRRPRGASNDASIERAPCPCRPVGLVAARALGTAVVGLCTGIAVPHTAWPQLRRPNTVLCLNQTNRPFFL